MSDKMKNLVTRTLSGAVFIAVFVGAVLWSQWGFWALLLCIMIGCQTEFYRLCLKGGINPQRVAGLICSIALFLINMMIFMWVEDDNAAFVWNNPTLLVVLTLYFILLQPAMFICELWRRSETPIANVSATIAGVVYIVLPLSLLPYIVLMLGHGGVWNALVLLGYMLLVWGNDVFAYLAGVMFGRHKMFERISPKKSWEGFAGGIAGAVLIGLAVCRFIESDWSLWCGLAVVVAVSGVAGDLVESMFKRSVGVKDSGNILPGHGGWLDRFDALLISVPFAFVYTMLWCACCK